MRGAKSYFLSNPVKISCQQYIFQQEKHTFGKKKDFKIHGKLEQKHHKGKKMNKLNLFEAFLYLPRYPAYNVKRW